MFQTINFNKKFLLVLITSFSVLAPAQEKHLKTSNSSIFGGDNAEAPIEWIILRQDRNLFKNDMGRVDGYRKGAP